MLRAAPSRTRRSTFASSPLVVLHRHTVQVRHAGRVEDDLEHELRRSPSRSVLGVAICLGTLDLHQSANLPPRQRSATRRGFRASQQNRAEKRGCGGNRTGGARIQPGGIDADRPPGSRVRQHGRTHRCARGASTLPWHGRHSVAHVSSVAASWRPRSLGSTCTVRSVVLPHLTHWCPSRLSTRWRRRSHLAVSRPWACCLGWRTFRSYPAGRPAPPDFASTPPRPPVGRISVRRARRTIRRSA